MQTRDQFDGVLLVDKPVGPTSHDVVDVVRNRFRIKKAGHCGTLDPKATGLLIIVVGRATKLSERFMGQDKTYEGAVQFGVQTSSYDSEGDIVETLPVPALSVESLNEASKAFVGDQLQTPPMASAIKKDGVPLYKLARKGIEVERKPRMIHIYQFRFSSYQEPVGEFRVICTKGTYVRSLAHDLGQKLGCGAHLQSLRRTVSGDFQVDSAVTWDRLQQMTITDLGKAVIPITALAGH